MDRADNPRKRIGAGERVTQRRADVKRRPGPVVWDNHSRNVFFDITVDT